MSHTIMCACGYAGQRDVESRWKLIYGVTIKI